MLELIQVDVAVGGFLLLEKADWKINPGQRVGLVGRNGAGKSTLLKTIIGQHPLESGRIVVRPDLQPGYLPQHAVSGSARTLWEETSSGMVRMIRLREELEIAEAAAREGRPKAEARLERALEAWRLAGGPSAEERVGEVLHGLGFVRTDWERPCASFSGGWQMRIALAKLLLAEPDLLLLDEPTNHLDLHARAWLSKFLARYPHAVVLVSHDRHLLDEATTHTAELVEGRLEVYGGGFSFWVHNRAERRAQQKAAWEGQQEEIARIQRFIERFRYSATKASQAQSRIKSLERMDRVEEVEEEFIPHLRLPVSDLAMPEPLELRKAQIGWPGGPALLTGLDLILARGMRLAILGPNGAGKSTLLRALAGDLPLQAGRRIQGKGVRIGVYHQDLTKELPAESAAVDVVLESWPLAQPQAARAALGALGLSGEPAFRKIGALSGGEKARVALACLTLRPVEVLLLDEPTNHLDVVTVEVLVQALAAWEGAMLFITHDRYLVEKVATHVAHTDGQNWRIHEGVRPDDFEPLALQRLIEGGGDSGEGATSYADRKKQARDRDRLRKRVAKIGEEIEQAEGQLAQVDASLCTPGTDHRRAQQLSAERSALEAKIQALYAEWEQSEAQLAG